MTLVNLYKIQKALSIRENLVDLFNSLDRRASYNELRSTQKEILGLLSHRRTEKDLVLKASTGLGKTAVGLLYLYAHMHKKKEPVVYFCPTVQLVKQVLEEAT